MYISLWVLDVIKYGNKTISKATVCKRGITEEISIQWRTVKETWRERESAKGVRGDDDDRSRRE